MLAPTSDLRPVGDSKQNSKQNYPTASKTASSGWGPQAEILACYTDSKQNSKQKSVKKMTASKDSKQISLGPDHVPGETMLDRIERMDRLDLEQKQEKLRAARLQAQHAAGGRVRASLLTPERRCEIARMGARARLAKRGIVVAEPLSPPTQVAPRVATLVRVVARPTPRLLIHRPFAQVQDVEVTR